MFIKKYRKLIVVVIFVILAATGYVWYADRPENVAHSFLKAVVEGNTNQAETMLSSESKIDWPKVQESLKDANVSRGSGKVRYLFHDDTRSFSIPYEDFPMGSYGFKQYIPMYAMISLKREAFFWKVTYASSAPRDCVFSARTYNDCEFPEKFQTWVEVQ